MEFQARNGLAVAAALLLVTGCHLEVKPVTLHPDTASLMEVEADLVGESPSGTTVKINNVQIASCAGADPCVGTGGPYPTAGGATILLQADATGSSGRSYSDSVQWPVINCMNHWSYTPPTGIPTSLATQTGPNLYQLSDSVVQAAAQDALIEYANDQGILITEVDSADEYVAAVAAYVDNHMSWTSDGSHNPNCINTVHGLGYSPGWDFPIPASYTITYTGDPSCNCPNDYCGDCEDHAILRAALLRALGFAPECIWDAIDNPVSHEYNVVVYEGAFRLMDYGPISSWLATHTWSAHRSYYGWNENNGPRGTAAANHTFLTTQAVNYGLHDSILSDPSLTCQAAPDYYNYYEDTCP